MTTREKKSAMSTTNPSDPQPLLSFRAALLTKLNLIIRHARTKSRAIRRLEVSEPTFYAWFREPSRAISQKNLLKIDAAYAHAFALRLKRRKYKRSWDEAHPQPV